MGEVVAFKPGGVQADVWVPSSLEGMVGVASPPGMEWQVQTGVGTLALAAGGETIPTLFMMPPTEQSGLYLVTDAAEETEGKGPEGVESHDLLATVHYIGDAVFEAVTRPDTPEISVIGEDDRYLTEVDHFIRNRRPDRSHPDSVRMGVRVDLKTAAKEAAIPQAVSKILQEHTRTGEKDANGRPIGTYMFLGKTAIQVAEGGYAFYHKPEARLRTGVEVDEAEYDETMPHGSARVMLSLKDEGLKDEGLGNADALRIKYLREEASEDRVTESILVKDVELEDWEAMLNDPNNIWGRTIPLEEPHSQLAIMKAHRELEIPLDRLPEGVVSLVTAVMPYIKDPERRRRVEWQLMLFREDQEEIDRHAESIAERWMQFEISLADSLLDDRANEEILLFIDQLHDQWSDVDKALFDEHRTPAGDMRMSRKLAARLERAKRNLLWTAAAVVAGNMEVVDQMSVDAAQQIYEDEMRLQELMVAPQINIGQIMALERRSNQTIARQNTRVGGGCAGDARGGFGKETPDGFEQGGEDRTAKTPNPFDEDGFGSLYFDCPHCHKVNRRPRAKTPKDFLDKCKHCNGAVNC